MKLIFYLKFVENSFSHRIFEALKKELRQCLSNSFKSQIETEHHEEFEYEMPNGSNSNPSDSYLQITMREYVEISPESEFRCFIKSRQLVGISQYESGLYCNSLQNPEKQQEIKAKLTSFYERISHLFYDNEFIMDVVMVGERIYIIEISPYVYIYFLFATSLLSIHTFSVSFF